MLTITNLHASVGDRPILKGIDLSIKAGEVHAIMGPNGSGKSTLSYILAGRDGYTVTEGSVTYNGEDLLALPPEKRAATGVFLAFQYPVEIPGVSNSTFLKTALNAVRRQRGESELDAMQFLKLARAKCKTLGMTDEMLKRAVNVGFSGGETAGEHPRRQSRHRGKVGAKEAVDEDQPVRRRHRGQGVDDDPRRGGRRRQKHRPLQGAEIGEAPSLLPDLGKAQLGKTGATGTAQTIEQGHVMPPR